MIELTIPSHGEVHLDHLVLDVNGTLAVDGQLIDGVLKRITSLRDRLTVHLLTADTHGRQQQIDGVLGLKAIRINKGDEIAQKTKYVKELGSENVVAIGQGANDAGMLKTARIGIAVLSPEGLATETLQSSDLITSNIIDALDILEKPLRLIATLRK